jgi:IS30 family transposase
MSNYRRIKYEDRCQIYALSKRGASQESIDEILGVSPSAVSREMCRNRQRWYRLGEDARAACSRWVSAKPN